MPPDTVAHINQAQHNHKCAAAFIKTPNIRDWALISAFYAALHYTMAVSSILPEAEKFHFVPAMGSRHLQQTNWVRRQLGNKCYKAYRELHEASDRTRYIRDFSGAEKIPSLSYYNKQDAEIIINGLNTIISETKLRNNFDLDK